MLPCQRHLFSLATDDAYLNGASRSPQLIAGAEAARAALAWRERDSSMPIPAFFDPVRRVRESFARLVNVAEPDRIALIPAVSYGIATVARNLPLDRGQEVIVVADQFPSNYYTWERVCADAGARLVTVARPAPEDGRSWSTAVLEAVGPRTAAVAIANVHWADGSYFDLAALRDRTDEVGAWLVVDGTQSVGAFPFDVARIRPDALIVAGYKWMLGPYGCGYAYYGPRMDGGVPLEENWINRADSHEFQQLVNYRAEYRPLAGRYAVGEHSNFLLIPMLQAALDVLHGWGPAKVQAYTTGLWAEVTDALAELGVSRPADGVSHLVGLRLPDRLDGERLREELVRRRISVSYRGDALRVSPSVYNRPEELGNLLEAVRAALG